ncbi:hypothetical protein GQ53DRAFT_795912 [Thozetella sp. PMI_491]|nr:hypothetical protein GQ53DRAFT_795912 [Thozetella sp. PMI_491]
MQIRALFGDHSGSSEKAVCPVQSLDENAASKFLGDLTFYDFNKILSGACAAFSLVIMLAFMLLHATHFSKPNEQLKILRISFIIPLYALVSWISVLAPEADAYIKPWLDFIQSISLGSFFLLMCEFVSPSEKQRDVFFAALTINDKKANKAQLDGLSWFRTRWILIFQYPVVSLLVAVLTDITQAAGVYCEFETNIHFAKIWLTIIGSVSLAIAITGVLKFYGQLKTHLAHHQPLAKLLAFKLIVGLGFLQNIIFLILSSTSNLEPTSTLTYADLHIGLPRMITCIETIFFSLFFHYAYSWRAYDLKRQESPVAVAAGEAGIPFKSSYQGGPFGIYALLGMLNPSEIFEAIVFAVKMKTESRRGSRPRSTSPGYDQRDTLLGINMGGRRLLPEVL